MSNLPATLDAIPASLEGNLAIDGDLIATRIEDPAAPMGVRYRCDHADQRLWIDGRLMLGWMEHWAYRHCCEEHRIAIFHFPDDGGPKVIKLLFENRTLIYRIVAWDPERDRYLIEWPD